MNTAATRKAATSNAPLHCRQAIVTKYHGPTDSRGSRVSATADAGRVYLSWDAELNTEQNHQRAALALSAKFGWSPNLVGAGLPGNAGYVWSQVPDEYADAALAVFETRLAMARGENNGNPHCRAFGKAVDALTDSGEFKTEGAFAAAYELWKDTRELAKAAEGSI